LPVTHSTHCTAIAELVFGAIALLRSPYMLGVSFTLEDPTCAPSRLLQGPVLVAAGKSDPLFNECRA